MKHSSPNPWLYGGTLQRMPWLLGPTFVTCWDGQARQITTGDVLLILRTPVGVKFVDVEPVRAVA